VLALLPAVLRTWPRQSPGLMTCNYQIRGSSGRLRRTDLDASRPLRNDGVSPIAAETLLYNLRYHCLQPAGVFAAGFRPSTRHLTAWRELDGEQQPFTRSVLGKLRMSLAADLERTGTR
jgi:hypothetical protein